VKRVDLEKVLALEPSNQTAKAELVKVQQQIEAEQKVTDVFDGLSNLVYLTHLVEKED